MKIIKITISITLLTLLTLACSAEGSDFKYDTTTDNDSYQIEHNDTSNETQNDNETTEVPDKTTIPNPEDIAPEEWGFEETQQLYVSNNRYYEWYIDQKETGTYNYENCGPSSTVMAAKWSDSSFTKTATEARKRFRSSGGWWYTSDIDSYLTEESIPHVITELKENTITEMIDTGKIIILCLDMSILRRNSIDENHIDRFYDNVTGHFIVIKGYREFENEIFLESYDPNSWEEKYSNEILKGRDRYYRLSEILSSASAWWNYGIVVSKTESESFKIKSLTFSEIPDASGGG